MKKSMLLLGESIENLIEAPNGVLILNNGGKLFILKDWKVIYETSLPEKIAIEQGLHIPGFDPQLLPFLITYAKGRRAKSS